MKGTRRIVLAAAIVVVLLAGIAGAYRLGTMQSSGLTPDPDAQAWQPSAMVDNSQGSGTKIPGFSTVVFPAGEKDVQITLYNPADNDCMFVYTLSLAGEDDPLYVSDGIEPGKAIQEITLNRELEEGEYTLEVHIQPYDLETGAAKNDAVVSADLLVAS